MVASAQGNQYFSSSYCCIPPRIVRITLSIIGAAICIGGVTVGSIGLTSFSKTRMPFWLNKTITILKKEGCIGLIFGSYFLGTLLTEFGKDPIHSTQQASSIGSQNMLEIATRIPRVILSTLLDMVLMIPYGLFLGYHRCNPVTLPDRATLDKSNTYTILIHGTNSNSGTWSFAPCKGLGTVIPINLEENGSVLHEREKTIADFANRVAVEMVKINNNREGIRFNLIGHSMGGEVAAYLAEYLADANNITIDKVITIATPWQGSPTMDFLPNIVKPKRFTQMTEGNADLTHLIQKVTTSPRHYYMFGSATDVLVPSSYTFTESTSNIRQYRYPFLGHLGIVAMPFVWRKIRTILTEDAEQEAI